MTELSSVALDHVDQLHDLLSAPVIDWVAVQSHAVAILRITEDVVRVVKQD